ncbi:MAG: hypothetical protein CFE31_16895 [Rhizobiales bacterium PAR1]|nr:MAG: hypothetical protein CFE31_16895 [Rhizobiales bacterium PAR1]
MSTSFASTLLAARRSGKTITDFAGAPESLAEAVRTQRAVMEGLGETVCGWKVNPHPEVGGVSAPIFAGACKEAPTSWPFAERLVVEVEIAVRLKRDLPPGQYSREEIIAAIEDMSLGVEMCISRLPAGHTASPWTNLSDSLANEGYVISKASMPLAAVDYASLPCIVTLDGETLYSAPAKHPVGDHILPVMAYANAQSDLVGGLRAGHFITTGSLCGMVPVPRKGTLHVSLGYFGEMTLPIV